uniref:immunoglobulin-like domain-containing protein n=1 Tax=Pseudomonas fluorescens TaxID=294 RepID=UPI001782551D
DTHTVTLDETGHGTLSVDNPNTEDAFVDASTLVAEVITATGGNFEKLETGAKATATIADTESPVSIAVTANAATEADGKVVFNFQTSQAPQQGSTAVVLTVKVGNDTHTVTLDENGHGTLSVDNPNTEDAFVDASTLVAEVMTATGGNFEKLETGAKATATIADTESPVSIAVTANAATEADGKVVFNFQTSQAPQQGSTAVVLTVKVGNDTHTVTLDETGHGTLSVDNPNTEDAFVDASTLVAEVITATGGNFEKLETGAKATANIADTESPVGISVTANAATEADQKVTFNFQTSQAPQQGSTAVVLTVKVGNDTHTVTL